MYIYKIIWTSCVAFMACHGRSRGRATGRQSRQCDRQTPPPGGIRSDSTSSSKLLPVLYIHSIYIHIALANTYMCIYIYICMCIYIYIYLLINASDCTCNIYKCAGQVIRK